MWGQQHLFSHDELNLTVENCVDPISGNFFLHEVDLIAPGYEKIIIERSYQSNSQYDKSSEWIFLPHLFIYFEINRDKKKLPSVIKAKEPSGVSLVYQNTLDNRTLYLPHFDEKQKGMINSECGVLSGKTNLANHKILKLPQENSYVLICADGTKRYYKKLQKYYFAYLDKEQKPNGNWVLYEYDNEYSRVTKISTTNPSQTKIYAWVAFTYDHTDPAISKNFQIKTHVGDTVSYTYEMEEAYEEKYYRLIETRSNQPHLIHYHYAPNHSKKISLLSKYQVHQRGLEVSYYEPGINNVYSDIVKIEKSCDPIEKRVKTLDFIDENGKNQKLFSFFYNLGQHPKHNKRIDFSKLKQEVAYTIGYDANSKKYEYAYNSYMVPIHTYRYGQKNGDPNGLLSKTFYEWTQINHINFLSSKTLEDDDKQYFKKLFKYDRFGNLIEETICADNLQYTTLYHYEPQTNNLVFQEFPNGLKKRYHYLSLTDIKTAELTYEGARIILRKFYEYNHDHILVGIIEDDGSSDESDNLQGVTYRKITKNTLNDQNLIKSAEEKGWKEGKETLLKKTLFYYDKHLNVIKEEILDEHGCKISSHQYEYNQNQKIKKSIDPKGRESIYIYDHFGNLIEEKKATSFYPCQYKFDTKGNTTEIIRKNEKKNECSLLFYDLKNRLIKTIDDTKTITEYEYNDLDFEIEKRITTSDGFKKTISTKRDLLGNPVLLTDSQGNKIATTYNAFNLPTKIVYPDQTCEKFEYSKTLELIKHIHRDHTFTTFSYDALNRLISSSTFTKEGLLISSIKNRYKGELLLSQENHLGVKTTYLYDAFLRKKEERVEKQGLVISKKLFEYDPLGNIIKEINAAEKGHLKKIKEKLYDPRGNILVEIDTDERNKLHQKKEFFYDQFDRIIQIDYSNETQTAQEFFTYDKNHRITSFIDKEGRKTSKTYVDTFPNQVITLSPLSQKKTETLNGKGNVVLQEIHDEFGNLIIKKEFSYDSFDRIYEEKQIYYKNQQPQITLIKKNYDFFGNILLEEKLFNNNLITQTYFEYNSSNQLIKKSSSNQVSICYVYNEKNLLDRVYSSDETVDYRFFYDEQSRLVEEFNFLTKEKLKKNYSDSGNLEKEIFYNGAYIENIYDDFGRKEKMIFHDKTSIEYKRDSYHLLKVIRNNQKQSYEHQFCDFNLAGYPVKELLPFHLGELSTYYDQIGKKVSLSSNYHQFSILETSKQGFPTKTLKVIDRYEDSSLYCYDEHFHLTFEKGIVSHQYNYDDGDGITQKDDKKFQISQLNQISNVDQTSYEYSQTGARTKKKVGNKTLTYTYDAFERLIKLASENCEIHFTYDFQGRRLKKTLLQKGFFSGLYVYDEIFYLYDGVIEIGSYNKIGKILELKINSDTSYGDLGQTLALELFGNTYIPLHDTFGNIIALLDPSSQSIEESYYYSAFGETLIYDRWGFKTSYSRTKNPFRFQSKRIDEESSLYYFGARYLDTELGVWISQDLSPISDGINLYHFNKGNPLYQFDLFGYFSLTRDDSAQKIDYNVVPLLTQTNQTKIPYRIEQPSFSQNEPNSYKPYAAPNIFDSSGYKTSPNTRIFFINGINTSLKEAMEMQHACSKALGYNVSLFYNPSKQLLIDLHEISRLHRKKQSELVETLKNCLMHEISLGKQVMIFAHSGGGLVAFNTYEQLSKEIREKIHMITFGAAKYVPQKGSNILENYVSSKDLVATTSNIWHHYLNDHPSAYSEANRYTIIYLQPQSNSVLKEHSFLGKTYQNALQRKSDEIAHFLSR